MRIITRNDEPWFVLADVCAVLEIGNPSDAAKRLDADEKHTLDNVEGIAGRQVQSFTIINESGLYSLVLTSRKPEAKAFKKWLTSTVIPSLRKNGGYIVGQEIKTREQILADAVLLGQSVIAEMVDKVDRIVPHMGYVPSNIAVISNKANTCKSRCGPSELMDVGRWLMRMLTLNATAGGGLQAT